MIIIFFKICTPKHTKKTNTVTFSKMEIVFTFPLLFCISQVFYDECMCITFIMLWGIFVVVFGGEEKNMSKSLISWKSPG